MTDIQNNILNNNETESNISSSETINVVDLINNVENLIDSDTFSTADTSNVNSHSNSPSNISDTNVELTNETNASSDIIETNEIVESNENTNTVDEDSYDPEDFDDLYNTLVSLVKGTNYNETNWLMLLTRVMEMVSELKGYSVSERIKLTTDLVIYYLDNNTNLEDETLEFIRENVYHSCMSLLEYNGVNRTNHKNNKKAQTKTKATQLDLDKMPNPSQLTEMLLTKFTHIIKGQRTEFSVESLIVSLPSLVATGTQFMDKFKHLNGHEKKDIVVQTLQLILNDYIQEWFTITDEQNRKLEKAARALPKTVDIMVDVINGKYTRMFKDYLNKAKTILNALGMCTGKRKQSRGQRKTQNVQAKQENKRRRNLKRISKNKK